MMISENDLIKVEYSADKKCFYSAWKTTTENASWDDIKTGFNDYFLKVILENKPKYVIVDERQMRRPYSPDEQKWVDVNSAPRVINAGVEKIAIILSEDGFVELATETLMQESNSRALNTRFFTSIRDAETWLFS